MSLGTDEDVPRLEDWISVPEAAAILGMSKQGFHKMLRNKRVPSLRKIGNGTTPMLVVSEREVRALAERRAAAAQASAEPVSA